MTELPAPMTPPDCDLRDFPFMPLDVVRLRDSDMAATPDAEVFRAGVLAWCAAWHQIPAGSIPDDDATIARLIGMGRDVKGWKKLRAAGALRGFILCADGRLYHEVVAEKALKSWEAKKAQRDRTEKARQARLSQNKKPSVTDEEKQHNGSVVSITNASKGEVRDSEGKGFSTEEANASSGGTAAKLELVHAGKPDWWPKRDRYGRVQGDVTDKLLYDVGKAVLGSSAGGQITKLKKLRPYSRDWRAMLELLLRADDTSDPPAWFARALKNAEKDEPELPMHEVYPESEYRA